MLENKSSELGTAFDTSTIVTWFSLEAPSKQGLGLFFTLNLELFEHMFISCPLLNKLVALHHSTNADQLCVKAGMTHCRLFPLDPQALPLSTVSLKISWAKEIKVFQMYCCNSNFRELFRWLYNFDNLEFHLHKIYLCCREV